MTEKIVLGFGSNKGSRLLNLRNAVKQIALNKNFDMLALSSVYETEPWGYKNQGNFLNCTGVFLCRLKPAELLKFLKSTEANLGRTGRGKWQAREIDVDVLYYANYIIEKKGLTIPHPQINKRNFVLAPLVELLPGFIDPVHKKSVKRLAEISTDKCRAVKYTKAI